MPLGVDWMGMEMELAGWFVSGCLVLIGLVTMAEIDKSHETSGQD